MEDETTPKGEEQGTGATSEELGDGGKKALDAERRARRAAESELKELKAKAKEAEDAEKTEVEKLREQVATIKQDAEAATARADRFEVAADKGLTLAQARRLVGSTKEELEADADAMRTELGLKSEGAAKDDGKDGKGDEELPQDERPLGRPKEDLHAGASNTDDEQPNSAKLAESILRDRF